MSRKSVIQLVPAPTGCGDASDLRYRLLMAALGSSDEVNPLLVGPDAPPHEADEAAEADPETESAPVHASQNVPTAEPHAVEGSGVAGAEARAPALSLVRQQSPSPLPARNTGNETPAPGSTVLLPHPPKRR
jgi:hypothetical protein